MPALILTFVVSVVAALFFTARIRDIAKRNNFVDCPDGRRKIQKEPIALGGGVAIYLALICSLAVLWVTWNYWDWNSWLQTIHLDRLKPTLSINKAQVLLLSMSAGVLCIVGMYDDRYHMRGRNKLIWQIFACAILVYAPGGIVIRELSLFNGSLGNLGSLITMIWFIVSINSFNLIDGVDGLAGTVGIIFSAAFGIMAMMMGNVLDGILAFILVGAILGFLRYNFNPASIYMGDAGSMVIGLILGFLALRSSTKEAAVTACAAPLAVWTIPILDSGMAVLRRKLTGRSIYATDRGHIHHRLLTSGFSARQAVGLIGGLCLISSVSAIASIYYGKEWIGYLGLFFVFGLLVATRLFGHIELMLLNSKILGFGRAIIDWNDSSTNSRQSSHQLQGKLQWEEKIWFALVESAERFDLTKLRLNFYLPHIHEDFHASWSSKKVYTGNQQQWKLEIPLFVDGTSIGSLSVLGMCEPNNTSQQLTQFLDFLEPLEVQIRELLQLPAETLVAVPENVAETPAALTSAEHAAAEQTAAEQTLNLTAANS